MSDTPRTDDAAWNHGLGGSVSAYFARELERELNAANAEIERLKKELEAEWDNQAGEDL